MSSRRNHASGKGRVPHTMRMFVLHRDDYKCRACGTRGKPLQIDHVTPVNAGGKTVPENLQALCRGCHIAKTRRENGATEGAIEWTAFAIRRRRPVWR